VTDDLATRTPTSADDDAAKLEKLAEALRSSDVIAAAEAYRPPLNPEKPDEAKDPDWTPGVFEYAAAVRANLPDGLDAGDFDGVNIAQLLAE
jgi:hypothetical protein